jgi:hypothetical protein
MVRISDIPMWQIWHKNIVRVGPVSIIICQHLAHASSLIRSDYLQSQRESAKRTAAPGIYVILSLQEIYLCRINERSWLKLV